jgi:hypothetical protein
VLSFSRRNIAQEVLEKMHAAPKADYPELTDVAKLKDVRCSPVARVFCFLFRAEILTLRIVISSTMELLWDFRLGEFRGRGGEPAL